MLENYLTTHIIIFKFMYLVCLEQKESKTIIHMTVTYDSIT